MSENFADKKNSEQAESFADVVGSYFQNGNEGNGVETFADLLESYDSGMNEDVKVGDKIKGEIISIGMDTVFVNTGTKIDGAVEKLELLNENGELSCNVGDVLELYVVALDENELRLSKALSGAGSLNLIEDAYRNKVPVEGKIREECKGGFQVEILQKRAFCPIGQMDVRYVDTPQDYVGGAFSFLISRFEENGKNIVVSRRALLEKEQKEIQKQFLEKVGVGDVVEGKVSNIMPYGAFVELTPGLEGMVHVSEMSWSRVEKPDDILNVGDTTNVKIMEIGEGKKPGQLKISLSMKQISGDPWDSSEGQFKAGDKLRGKVTRCMGFGAFVEIAPGIEGLVHISEMSYTKRIAKPEDVVTEGESVDVTVKDVDLGNRRISLSIRDAEGDPWINVKERYSVGQSVEGVLEKKEKFGFFITLEPGVTGLLPKSKIKNSGNPSAIEKLKEGNSITVLVGEINIDGRKISLEPGDATDEGHWQQYTKGSGSSLGSLGEKLQEAMNARK